MNGLITWMRCSTCMLMFAGLGADVSMTRPGAGSPLSCSVLSGPRERTRGLGWAGLHGCLDTEHMPAATDAHLTWVLCLQTRCGLADRPVIADCDLKPADERGYNVAMPAFQGKTTSGRHTCWLLNTEQASCQVGTVLYRALRALTQACSWPGKQKVLTHLSQATRAAPHGKSRPQLGPGCSAGA